MSEAKTYLPSERITALRELLASVGVVRVDQLATRFGISTETVRRDLKLLAAEGLVELVRGGGRLVVGQPTSATRALPPVYQRAHARRLEKEAIGRAAAALVSDGQAVLLDGGTTTVAVARHLKSRHSLTIITNNLVVANEVARCPGWRIHVVGGELSPDSMSLVGLGAIRDLKATAVDLAFLGAAGVSVRQGFTSADPVESELKRAMMEIARKVVVVADHSKLQMSGFSTFAAPGDITTFVTSHGAEDEELEPFRQAGVEVIVTE